VKELVVKEEGVAVAAGEGEGEEKDSDAHPLLPTLENEVLIEGTIFFYKASDSGGKSQ